MANNIYGDFLTENPAVAQSAFGAHRVIPDRWKGMTPEQIADIKRTQELQIKEAQVRKFVLLIFEYQKTNSVHMQMHISPFLFLEKTCSFSDRHYPEQCSK